MGAGDERNPTSIADLSDTSGFAKVFRGNNCCSSLNYAWFFLTIREALLIREGHTCILPRRYLENIGRG